MDAREGIAEKISVFPPEGVSQKDHFVQQLDVHAAALCALLGEIRAHGSIVRNHAILQEEVDRTLGGIEGVKAALKESME